MDNNIWNSSIFSLGIHKYFMFYSEVNILSVDYLSAGTDTCLGNKVHKYVLNWFIDHFLHSLFCRYFHSPPDNDTKR